MTGSLDSVSYTHLDVYKRQQLCGQFLSDDHHGCLEKQTELDGGGDEGQNLSLIHI